jgi:hypothetical protein
MMVNSYYGIYQAERGKTATEIRAADAQAMCRGCRVRLACLAGALERREPWGVWGGELLMSGAIVPRKRPRGRPRRDVVTIGANAWPDAVDLAQPG